MDLRAKILVKIESRTQLKPYFKLLSSNINSVMKWYKIFNSSITLNTIFLIKLLNYQYYSRYLEFFQMQFENLNFYHCALED